MVKLRQLDVRSDLEALFQEGIQALYLQLKRFQDIAQPVLAVHLHFLMQFARLESV